MIQASKLAVEHVNAQGGILDGRKLVAVVGDSACSQQGGTHAAAKAVNVQQVVARVGANWSGATLAAAKNVNMREAVALTQTCAKQHKTTTQNGKAESRTRERK